MRLQFSECEHHKDLNHYADDLRAAGVKVVDQQLGANDDGIITVDETRETLKAKWEKVNEDTRAFFEGGQTL